MIFFLVESLEFSTCKIMLFTNRDHFNSFSDLDGYYFFSRIAALAGFQYYVEYKWSSQHP